MKVFQLIVVSLLVVSGCSISHPGLKKKEVGINTVYSQDNLPSHQEISEGQKALGEWKSANNFSRTALAEKLVKSKILLGMSGLKVRDLLGPPDGPYGYATDAKETVCDLKVEFDENGKVVDCYLITNN